MAVIEVPDIGVKKGNQIHSMRDMMVKAQGALKLIGNGCGIKKGNNIYVLSSGSIGDNGWVCQQKFINDYIDGEIDHSAFSTFEGEFNDVKLHGDKILLSHNGGFVEYNARTKQVTKQFKPTGIHPTVSSLAPGSYPFFAWFTVDKDFNVDYFYYYYGKMNPDVIADCYRNYTFNKYDNNTNSCTILYDNKDTGGSGNNNPASKHDICYYMIPFPAKEGNYILWSQNADSSWSSPISGVNGTKAEIVINLSKFETTSAEVLPFAGWADFMDKGLTLNASEHIFVGVNGDHYTYNTGDVDSEGRPIYSTIENRLSYFVTKNKTQLSIDRNNYNKYSYIMTDPNLQKPASILIEREDPTPRFIVVNTTGYVGLVDHQGKLIKRLSAFPESVKKAGYDRETKRLAGLTKTKCYYTTLNI